MFYGQLTCRCPYSDCDGGSLDKHLLIAMEEYDSRLPGYDSDVNSGFRCLRWNTHEGSGDNSLHPQRKAIDFLTRGLTPIECAAVAKTIFVWLTGGIGVYIYDKEAPGWKPEFEGRKGFVHCDIRGWKARWFYINGVKQSYASLVEALGSE